ncbi:MAG: FIG00800187: hypothetical protein, partial [uncultured Actinomycetospora sp.]
DRHRPPDRLGAARRAHPDRARRPAPAALPVEAARRRRAPDAVPRAAGRARGRGRRDAGRAGGAPADRRPGPGAVRPRAGCGLPDRGARARRRARRDRPAVRRRPQPPGQPAAAPPRHGAEQGRPRDREGDARRARRVALPLPGDGGRPRAVALPRRSVGGGPGVPVPRRGL